MLWPRYNWKVFIKAHAKTVLVTMLIVLMVSIKPNKKLVSTSKLKVVTDTTATKTVALNITGSEKLCQLQKNNTKQAVDVLSNGDVKVVKRDFDLLWPLLDHKQITSNYGLRRDPFTGKIEWHQGIDIGVGPGSGPFYIQAAADGIAEVKAGPGYGHYITLRHNKSLVTLYAHISKALVATGDVIKRGQPIAIVGSTGRSTGPHLHFEVLIRGQPVDPQRFFN